MMEKFMRKSLVVVPALAVSLFLACAGPAFGHGTVESASPRNGATLAKPPAEIRLRFNEPLEPAFTSVKVFDAAGKAVTIAGKARVEDGKTVVLPLPVLPPGGYKAQWTSVGHDGHRVRGELTFTVK